MADLEQGPAVMRQASRPVNGWQALAGLYGFSGVVMGALGAHAVADPALAALVERGSLYQLLHSLLLLWLTGRAGEMAGRGASLARVAVGAGILLFCGSLYAKAFLGWPAALAPFGGTLLMAGWLLAGFAMRKPHSPAL